LAEALHVAIEGGGAASLLVADLNLMRRSLYHPAFLESLEPITKTHNCRSFPEMLYKISGVKSHDNDICIDIAGSQNL
jgi:hypothetical protein